MISLSCPAKTKLDFEMGSVVCCLQTAVSKSCLIEKGCGGGDFRVFNFLVEISAGSCLRCDLYVFVGISNTNIDMLENLQKNRISENKSFLSCANYVYIKFQVVSIDGGDVSWLFWHRRVCCRSSFSSAR